MARGTDAAVQPLSTDGTWRTPVTLAPPEAFDDREADDAFRARFHPGHDPAQLGPQSRAVRNRLRASCAGWREKPGPEEFYAAIRSPAPSRRQRRLLACWLQEATREDFLCPGPRASIRGGCWPRRSTGPGNRRDPAAPTSTRWRRHDRPGRSRCRTPDAAGAGGEPVPANARSAGDAHRPAYAQRTGHQAGRRNHSRRAVEAPPARSCTRCPSDSIRYAATLRCTRSARRSRRYTGVTVTCDGGTVLVRTTSGWGEREAAYGTVEQLTRGFEASGMNLFLRAHGHSAVRTRERAIQAMNDGGQNVILDVQPRRPPQRAEPTVETPPAGGRGPDDRE